MGSGARQENAYHKWESGWLPSYSVLSVIRSGTYLLSPEEAASHGFSCWRSPDQPGPELLARSPSTLRVLLDTFSPLGSGQQRRLDPLRQLEQTCRIHRKSWLIDTTPWTASFADAPLGVGAPTPTRREASDHDALASRAGALVQVSVANGADTSPPGPPSGSQQRYVGDSLRIG